MNDPDHSDVHRFINCYFFFLDFNFEFTGYFYRRKNGNTFHIDFAKKISPWRSVMKIF